MSNKPTCPVCLSEHTANRPHLQIQGDRYSFDCEICGRFDLSKSLYAGPLDPERPPPTPLQRAALSHWIRRSAQENQTPPFLTTDAYERFMKDAHLPTPAQQAVNAIRYIGDEVRRTGKKVKSLQPALYARIGAPGPEMAGDVVRQLTRRTWVQAYVTPHLNKSYVDYLDVDLTLEGWEQYDKERTGKLSGRVGFLAMAFRQPDLEAFVKDVLKPAVGSVGYDLVDMRDVARAGIIDNLMREQIRDAAFVIVDLTHDNSGAYWEAGYAEGLGKPVIYICEKTKFDVAKTHFDTNHCTTVPWDKADPDGFQKSWSQPCVGR